jgi:hypothetical protein
MLLDAQIIFNVRQSTWVSNMVPVRKKLGEIKICINFRNRNHASDKDNYLVPTMEQILQLVYGSELLYPLDRFSGYNQVFVEEPD